MKEIDGLEGREERETMKPSDDDLKRLADLFKGLWGNREGVNGSWGASSFRYHPTYIRRGGLLLCGELSLRDLYVLVPAHAKVTPIEGDSCARCNTFPKIEGEAIKVSRYDAGPWWDQLINVELPKMEAELEEYRRKQVEKIQAEAQAREQSRAAELQRAAAALGGSR